MEFRLRLTLLFGKAVCTCHNQTEHKEAAEKFIDYMNRQDIAQKNFDYIYYGTPNRAVYDTLDDETKEDYTIFPEEATLDKCEVYKYLGEKTDQYYNRLWKELKSY